MAATGFAILNRLQHRMGMGMGISTLLAAALLAAGPAPAATVAPPAPVLAATPQFRHYNIDQGLPSSNVYTVVQDARGAIWMGTISGLARFDGNRFRVYRHIPGDASSLASDDVSSVLVDGKGRLWASGENSGINLFLPATGGFRHFRHEPGRADSLAGNDVMALAEGRDGSLWVGIYGHGLDHMTSPGHFTHLTHDPDDPHSLVSDNVLSLYSQDDGTLWIGTDKGLDVRAPDGTLRHVRFEGLDSTTMVWSISGDARRVRVATSVGLFVVEGDGPARHLLPHDPRPTGVVCSVRDRQGNLWIGTARGLFLVRDGHVTRFLPRPLVPDGQPGQLIWKLMVDSEGGLWIATQNAGVAYLTPDWRDFSHYAHEPDDDDSLSHSLVKALAGDGHGRLWVGGGRNQLDKLDPATGAVTHHGKMLGPTPRRIQSMARAGQHGLWIGSGSTLSLLDRGHLRTVAMPSRHLSNRRMVADAAGNLYVAPIDRGMYRVDRRTLQVDPVSLAFSSGKVKQTTDLVMHDGLPWRASHAGLAYLPPGSLQMVAVPGVAEGQVTALAIRGDDLWLIRPDSLEHYRLHGLRATLLKRIDARAGWPGITAYSMLVDKRGRVWLFGNAGLWRYDPATNRFRRYGKRDGLPSPEFTSRQLVRLDNGTVFAGTLGGVVGFRPATIDDPSRKPRLAITSIRVRRDGREVSLPFDTRHIHLDWNDRDLMITAHAFSYIDPQSNRYRFMLVGLDTGWVDTGSRGVRELAGLKPGHYRLKVQAAGPSGAWSRLAVPLSIDVDAPPWLRPWAWALYALGLLLVIYLVVMAWRRRLEQRHRLQLLEQKRVMAEQASKAKTRFLATLSHEIRTPMSGMLGMAELLLHAPLGHDERQHAQAIRRSGELMLKLVNDSLDMARIEAGRLQLEPAPMSPRTLLEDVRQLQSAPARAKGLAFDVRVDAGVPAWLEGDRHRIQQILLNLSNNAIKFTEHGGVEITAGYADGQLHLRVIDTGPGISEADRERLFHRYEQADSPQRSQGAGLGLAICRELVRLMHGRIELASAPGQGCRFDIFVPLPEVAPPASAATAPAPDVAPDAAPRAGLRLLLVEDDATVARALGGLLEARGHHVRHAGDGLAALSELESGPVDAVLMDIDLPGMDGHQLTRMIRAREGGGRHLPIIAITARSGGDEERQAREAGMDGFLRKPISGEQLAQALDALSATSGEA